MGASGHQSENPLSLEISSSERDAKFFYVQAKDDEAADALQRKAAMRDRKLSSQLRTMIELADVNLADKKEDYNYVRNAMFLLQEKIAKAKLIRSKHADDLRNLDIDDQHLQDVENSAQETLLENKEKLSALRNRAKIVRERQEEIKKSIGAILSRAKIARMEEIENGKSIKKQKVALNLVAEKLVHEDRKADILAREGILAKRKATYLFKHGYDKARQLEDLSLFDIGKGLILSDKTSSARREFTKEYRQLQKLESKQVISARKIEDLSLQMRPEITSMTALKQYLFSLKSAEHGLQGSERVISHQFGIMNKLLRRNNRRAKTLSKENEQAALKYLVLEKHQLLTQLGDLYSDEGMERVAASQDQVLQQDLDRAARLHLLSMDRLGDAAEDAADSAAKLLAASSLLNSAAVKKTNQGTA